MTFSLLPDCLASHFPGTLSAIEAVATEVERGESVEAIAERLRPDITLPAAVRWVQRRVGYVRRALAVTRGLEPEVFAGVEPSLAAFAAILAVPELLFALRERLARFIEQISSPLGLRRWLRGGGRASTRAQQSMGAAIDEAPP
jgi:hypothetical protein